MSFIEESESSGVVRKVQYVPSKKQEDPDTCACIKYARSSADPDATENTKELLRTLYDLSQSRTLMFGQQNAGHIGISMDRFDGTDSDVKRIAGVHPAVVGIDALT